MMARLWSNRRPALIVSPPLVMVSATNPEAVRETPPSCEGAREMA